MNSLLLLTWVSIGFHAAGLPKPRVALADYGSTIRSQIEHAERLSAGLDKKLTQMAREVNQKKREMGLPPGVFFRGAASEMHWEEDAMRRISELEKSAQDKVTHLQEFNAYSGMQYEQYSQADAEASHNRSADGGGVDGEAAYTEVKDGDTVSELPPSIARTYDYSPSLSDDGDDDSDFDDDVSYALYDGELHDANLYREVHIPIRDTLTKSTDKAAYDAEINRHNLVDMYLEEIGKFRKPSKKRRSRRRTARRAAADSRMRDEIKKKKK
jgi:hypothetical protein